MFKLYSKIKYIYIIYISINCRRQLAGKEPERVQSLSVTTMDIQLRKHL